MKKCPVCEKKNSGLQCKNCGFDGSRDYEQYPTFGKIVGKPESVSARRAALAMDTWKCPECETINSGDKCFVCGQDRPEKEEKKVCSCGYQNTIDARFCAKCGRRLDSNRKKVFLILALAAVMFFVAFDPHTHEWKAATCTAPETCTICGKTTGTTAAHQWKAATCTTPKTCKICGHTTGTAVGHQWKDATCTTPKTCTVCGQTAGSAAAHQFKSATCTTPKTCKICGHTTGITAAHQWTPATYTAPKTCSVCGETEGTKLGGYIDKITDSSWESVTLGYANTYGVVFGRTLKECRELTVNLTADMKGGTKCVNWQLWGKVNGQYKKIGTFELPEGTGKVSRTFNFDDPLDLSAVAVTPKASGGFSWNQDLYITDIYFKE